MKDLRRLAGPAAFFALAVLWSNIWGQARDTLASSWFTNREAAAYNLAWQIPFNAPQIITLALMAAMVPVLVELRRTDESEAKRVARGIILAMTLLLTPLMLAGLLATGPILHLFFWNPKAGSLSLAVHLSRILFPYLVISGVSGAIAATLQSFERFRPLAVGQLAPNVAIVACMVGLHHSLHVTSQALGLLLGAVSYLGIVAVAVAPLLFGSGTTPKDAVSWWRHPATKAIAVGMLPLLLVNLADWGSSQLTVYRAVSWVQTVDESAWKEFQNAYRILQIPQGIFVSALTLVLLPYLSRFAAAGDRSGLASATLSGIRLVLFAVAPAVVLLGSLTLPVLNILYRHGQFTNHQAGIAAPLAAIMAPYVLFSSMAEVLILCLLALRRVWALLLVQLLSLIAAAVLCQFLAVHAGLKGIAGGVTVIALFNLALLFIAVERHAPIHSWKDTGQFLWKLTAACAGLWIWLTVLRRTFEAIHPARGVLANAVEIVVGVAVSALLYSGISAGLRIPEWDVVWSQLRRFRPAGP